MDGHEAKYGRRAVAVRAFLLIGSALLLFMTVLFFVKYRHSTVGWFVQNRTAEATDARVAPVESFYELAVSPAQETPYAASSDVLTYLETEYGVVKQPETSSARIATVCRFVNENPYDPTSDELAPGSFGKISFDLVIKHDRGIDDFTVDLDYLALGSGPSGPEAPDSATQAELQELLAGHILMFSSRSALQNGGYYYSDFIDGSFTFTLSEHTGVPQSDGVHYTVELYWIWPVTFAQLALKEGNPKLHSHAIFDNETDRAAMLETIKANQNEFFKSLNAAVNFNRSDFEDYYFVELSDGYNSADQFIGDNTHYLVLFARVMPDGQA